ncbi:unnamed protein product [Heterobilharzia americana]|nr:unnamed protein product [Heterobilharzia americana]CAH8454570.1 unnamed protein product [Heterobilharzia americana]
MQSLQNTSQIHSTAGAVPVKNEKGQFYMVKVKVQRYVAGKKPDFASSSSSGSDEEQTVNDTEEIKAFTSRPGLLRDRLRGQEHAKSTVDGGEQPTAEELADPRFRRLMRAKDQLSQSSEDEEEADRVTRHKKYRKSGHYSEESPQNSDAEDADEEDVDEAELMRRRELIRKKALAAQINAEAEKYDRDAKNDTGYDDAEAEDELGYSEEEYTSSDDEVAPKLKPVFVRARDRITLQAKHKADQLAQETEAEVKRLAEERRKTTLKMLEIELRREADEAHAIEDALDALDSDEGQGNPQAEQEEYEKWKVRELKRIRRDREIREAVVQEKAEIERIRNMTDEQRREEFIRNPKLVTNKSVKGKYKFLQKYFHRGAFFVTATEDKVFQQDFTQPTLEDHFDKTKLPTVMQVKNFGRAGRTKYTHLVDQDTTVFDSPWSTTNPQNMKFQSTYGGGFKQIFSRPGVSKQKKKTG